MLKNIVYFCNGVKKLYLHFKKSYTKPLLELYAINHINKTIDYKHIKTGKRFVQEVNQEFIKYKIYNFSNKDVATIGSAHAKWQYFKHS
jgi:hypothetical protein